MLLNSLRTIQKQLVARNVSTVSSHVNTSSVLTPECLEFIDKIHNFVAALNFALLALLFDFIS